MSNSREGSPDWLHSFQAPTQSVDTILSLSSDSEHSLNGIRSEEDKNDCEVSSPRKSSGLDEDEDEDDGLVKLFLKRNADSPSGKKLKEKSPKQEQTLEVDTPSKKKKSDGSKEIEEGSKKVYKRGRVQKSSKPHERNDSVLALSSDSDPEFSPPIVNDIQHGESSDLNISELQSSSKGEDAAPVDINEDSPSKEASKRKYLKKGPKGNGQSPKKEKKKVDVEEKEEVAAKEASEKRTESRVFSSTLPLLLAEKVNRSKALVECEGDSIDLSGDMGAVGRVVVSNTRSGNKEMSLDLKGTVYKTTIVPSRTFCVVSFGQSEAKIEAIMNDFIQLKPESYEAETMVEGTLEGFSFDSEDEADKVPKANPHQNDQNEDAEEQTNGTTKGKAEKASKVVKKRAKPAGGKPPPAKKARKKTQVSKKAKSKK